MVVVKFCSVFLCVLYLSRIAVTARRPEPVYSNEFAVHIPDGGDAANEIATRHGFTNRGQVGHFKHNLSYRFLRNVNKLCS